MAKKAVLVRFNYENNIKIAPVLIVKPKKPFLVSTTIIIFKAYNECGIYLNFC